MKSTPTLGQRLGVLAVTSGKTQTEISENIGMSLSKLNRFFNGKANLNSDNLVLVLNELGIDLEETVESKLQATAKTGTASLESKADCVKFLFEQLDPVGQQVFLNSIADDVKRNRKTVFPRSLSLALEKELNLI